MQPSHTSPLLSRASRALFRRARPAGACDGRLKPNLCGGVRQQRLVNPTAPGRERSPTPCDRRAYGSAEAHQYVDYALAEMATGGRDPYQVLGVTRNASDEEVRSAYRRLAQLHHPDHNGGSLEAARRFEEVQDAYAEIVRRRRGSHAAQRATSTAHVDPDLERQLADLERELRNAARAARERARRAARDAAATYKHATDEELGYIHTDDSFGKILADARHELSERLSEARRHPIGKTVSELIDELASKLTGGGRPGADD